MENDEGSARRPDEGTTTDAAGDAASRGRGEAISRLASAARPLKITAEERAAATEFIKAALQALKKFNDTSEEEYCRAGKLHKYDPDTEWQKCVARVARIYPPPKFIAKDVDGLMKILEEDEQDLPIGLAGGCAGIFEDL